MPYLLPVGYTSEVIIVKGKKLYSEDKRLFQDLSYKLEFSRRKSMSIIVSPDKGVTVRAPLRTPVLLVEKFVAEKSAWIIKSLDSFKSLKRLDKPEGYSNGETILLFGEPYRLNLITSERNIIRLNDGRNIDLECRGKIGPLVIRSLLESWFRDLAKQKLRSKFIEALARYHDFGFKPTSLSVRTMKKRWGSCSSRGKIALSYDLIRLDEIYSDYVIAHELCHLKHHNHGQNYYKLLSEVYPDWKKVRGELKKYLR